MASEVHVFGLDGVEVVLELIDLLHVLVLNAEVLELRLHLANAVLDLVLLLDVHHELIELLLKRDDLLVYSTSYLIFLSLIENELFNVIIDLLDAEDDLLGVGLYLPDLIKDPLDLRLLRLQIHDDLIDAL